MSHVRALLLVLAGCGNDLPSAGDCDAATSSDQPIVTSIALTSDGFGFDDLRYAPDLGTVIAVPEGSGQLYLVDPDDDTFTEIDVPGGTSSADGKGTLVYGANRSAREIVTIDTVAGAVAEATSLDAGIDYVRASPTTDEVWATMPGAGRIEYFTISGTSLTRAGEIAIGDAEGLVFDGAGFAYTNDGGTLVQIDVATHAVRHAWSDGCGGSHGFPQTDTDDGLVFGGCSSSGGVGVVSTDDGTERAGFESGDGPAILAYDQALHHLYLRGDGTGTLDILGVCTDGSLMPLASVSIPRFGHGATADEQGHAWVCDPEHGGIVKVTDPFPPSASSR